MSVLAKGWSFARKEEEDGRFASDIEKKCIVFTAHCAWTVELDMSCKSSLAGGGRTCPRRAEGG